MYIHPRYYGITAGYHGTKELFLSVDTDNKYHIKPHSSQVFLSIRFNERNKIN